MFEKISALFIKDIFMERKLDFINNLKYIVCSDVWLNKFKIIYFSLTLNFLRSSLSFIGTHTPIYSLINALQILVLEEKIFCT